MCFCGSRSYDLHFAANNIFFDEYSKTYIIDFELLLRNYDILTLFKRTYRIFLVLASKYIYIS